MFRLHDGEPVFMAVRGRFNLGQDWLEKCHFQEKEKRFDTANGGDKTFDCFLFLYHDFLLALNSVKQL